MVAVGDVVGVADKVGDGGTVGVLVGVDDGGEVRDDGADRGIPGCNKAEGDDVGGNTGDWDVTGREAGVNPASTEAGVDLTTSGTLARASSVPLNPYHHTRGPHGNG